MAKIGELNNAEWEAWVSSKTQTVQDICKKFPPNILYRLKSTGQRVTILAYSEDGTVRVNVSGDFNVVVFERQVFGINPDDLEECDLPTAHEIVGTLTSNTEVVDAFCKRMPTQH